MSSLLDKQDKKQEKNYAFIDSQNLNLGVKSQGWDLDFARFYIYLKDKYKVKKAFIFIGYVAGNEVLYTYLQTAGFICIFKPILEIKEKGKIKIKGNVDAELVLHTMIEYSNYDKAIIVSGDGDFHCLIEYLEKKEKLGRIIIPNRKAYSQFLWRFGKYIDYMNNLDNKLKK
ncbi:MAG: NYN domain-containing protein [Candidatus Portnoybacteria bacterium]|nr:NYN domain-containing protein [Candidatus Portnoybacteria bacterium]